MNTLGAIYDKDCYLPLASILSNLLGSGTDYVDFYAPTGPEELRPHFSGLLAFGCGHVTKLPSVFTVLLGGNILQEGQHASPPPLANRMWPQQL